MRELPVSVDDVGSKAPRGTARGDSHDFGKSVREELGGVGDVPGLPRSNGTDSLTGRVRLRRASERWGGSSGRCHRQEVPVHATTSA